MKYNLRYTGEFKRSLKRCLKRGYDAKPQGPGYNPSPIPAVFPT